MLFESHYELSAGFWLIVFLHTTAVKAAMVETTSFEASSTW